MPRDRVKAGGIDISASLRYTMIYTNLSSSTTETCTSHPCDHAELLFEAQQPSNDSN